MMRLATQPITADQARHQALVRGSAGARLRQALRDVAVEKGTADPPRPRPQTYFDVESAARNAILTPGGMGRLVGRLLAFDPADPQQDIFFLDEADVETRVEKVGWIKPALLMFTVPALAAGEYSLVVRTILKDNTKMREGKLDSVLTVV